MDEAGICEATGSFSGTDIVIFEWNPWKMELKTFCTGSRAFSFEIIAVKGVHQVSQLSSRKEWASVLSQNRKTSSGHGIRSCTS